MDLSTRKTLFFTPYWIKNVLTRNGLSLSTILDINSLSEILSSEDLAMIAFLNTHSEKFLGVTTSDCSALFSNWHKNEVAQSKYFNQVEPLFRLVEQDIQARLFLDQAIEERYPNAFDITDIDQNVFLVTIYPGYFGSKDSSKYQNNLLQELLRLFYVYEGYDDMARRQLFEQYMQRLA